MKVAALYDIHGNLPALEAVLAAVAQADVDMIVVGGDFVTGPMPTETLECLCMLGIPIRFLRGNGEREVVEMFDGSGGTDLPPDVQTTTGWVARQISPTQRDFLADLPPTITIKIDGLGETLFCHATPQSDLHLFTRRTSDARLRRLLGETLAPVIVCGHTHMPFDRTLPAGEGCSACRIVNAGSVGMGYGSPGACWAQIGPDVTFHLTPYDQDDAASRLRRSGYPTDFAGEYVLHPSTEAEALNAFEQAARDDRD